MFNFFTALFGTSYYGHKRMSERSRMSQYEFHAKEVRDVETKIRGMYAASFRHMELYKKMILEGNHYNEICRKFQKEFEFVFGSQWRDILDIPPKPTYRLNCAGNYTNHDIILPDNHTYWVYHLLLADDGKIDDTVIFPTNGLSVGGIDCVARNMKFIQCIENRLISKGVDGVRLVFKPYTKGQYVSGTRPETLCGGRFIIESTAFDKSNVYRLW